MNKESSFGPFSVLHLSSIKGKTNKNYFNETKITQLFLTTIFLALATFARPNFFPCVTLMTIYIMLNICHKSIFAVVVVLIGYSLNFTSLLHNLYYGDSFILFTEKTNIHFAFFNEFQTINKVNSGLNLLIDQFLKWNPLYNIHRLIILIFISFVCLKERKNLFINFLFLSCIAQHGVLLLTHPDSRYAYLAWLITLIIFVYISYKKNYFSFLNKLIFKKI